LCRPPPFGSQTPRLWEALSTMRWVWLGSIMIMIMIIIVAAVVVVNVMCIVPY